MCLSSKASPKTRQAARWRRVATRIACSSSASAPVRVPSSRDSIRARWKRRTLRPASASGSSARTPGDFGITRRGAGEAAGVVEAPSAATAEATASPAARGAPAWATASSARSSLDVSAGTSSSTSASRSTRGSSADSSPDRSSSSTSAKRSTTVPSPSRTFTSSDESSTVAASRPYRRLRRTWRSSTRSTSGASPQMEMTASRAALSGQSSAGAASSAGPSSSSRRWVTPPSSRRRRPLSVITVPRPVARSRPAYPAAASSPSAVSTYRSSWWTVSAGAAAWNPARSSEASRRSPAAVPDARYFSSTSRGRDAEASALTPSGPWSRSARGRAWACRPPPRCVRHRP